MKPKHTVESVARELVEGFECAVVHRTCDRCLEPDYACGCLAWDLDVRNQPEVAWVASRSLKPGSATKREKKHYYGKACKEVERLNRLYAGKVQHFLLPVSRTNIIPRSLEP